MSAPREFRNQTNPRRHTWTVNEATGKATIKLPGCAPEHFLIEPSREPGKRISVRRLPGDVDRR